MTTRPRFTFRLPLPAFALAMLGMLTLLAPAPALAQTFNVLYTFTGGVDGQSPNGVTVAGPGLLYGTTSIGGTHNYGTVFKLAQRGSGWTLNPLYEFPNGSDGGQALAGVTVGPNGALYGTTSQGGSENGGTVFELQPPATACNTAICYWNETVLHSFPAVLNDGDQPQHGNLTLDQAGNMYGTTIFGGTYDRGMVFELSPSGGEWTESVPHSFQPNGADGYEPEFGLILDPAGNLYGTTSAGGTAEGGTVFELSPSGGTWTENILYNFPSDSGILANPTTLIMDQSGNLYGSDSNTAEGNGSVFELTRSGGGWIFSTLYSFARYSCIPQPLAMDTAGNLYGACALYGRYDVGWVFELTNSGGSWTLTDLYDFIGHSDGRYPYGPVVLDSSGNLYGTTQSGGNLSDCPPNSGCGVVWEITPAPGLGASHP